VSTAVGSRDELRTIYKRPNPRSAAKELPHLDVHCRRFVELSPFVVMGTSGATGQDVSPRGGPPGFVKVVDAETLIIPDFPGNNRLDSFENILEDGRVGLLFLVPGVDESLRVNGRATIDRDPALRAMGTVDGKLPVAVIRVVVEQAYLHCGKALMRSALWDPAAQVDRTSLPSMGEMLKDQLRSEQPAETQAEMVRRYEETLY
jgi:PPOX class probable FMN-dependent enzyme